MSGPVTAQQPSAQAPRTSRLDPYRPRRQPGLSSLPIAGHVLFPDASPMAHGGTSPPNGESVDAMFFQNYGVNPFVATEDDHLSTFATDTDSASYAMARQYLVQGHPVPKDAVRVEEFINAFDYDYPTPTEGDFTVHMEACA
ncbi:MAG: hypothetical protein GY809_01145, partial [Planctomycetes bacterium]|nr:hypothetical protein [Planctomycetota bacterium]